LKQISEFSDEHAAIIYEIIYAIIFMRRGADQVVFLINQKVQESFTLHINQPHAHFVEILDLQELLPSSIEMRECRSVLFMYRETITALEQRIQSCCLLKSFPCNTRRCYAWIEPPPSLARAERLGFTPPGYLPAPPLNY
jgi:hypothetical protein